MEDVNTADKQSDFQMIAANTVAPFHLTLRPGGAGDGGWLKRSKVAAAERSTAS